jgi:hypothetical protein
LLIVSSLRRLLKVGFVQRAFRGFLKDVGPQGMLRFLVNPAASIRWRKGRGISAREVGNVIVAGPRA